MEKETVIKALECCLTPECANCAECPARLMGMDCVGLVKAEILALIKELTEENERLRERSARNLENLKAVLEERSENGKS